LKPVSPPRDLIQRLRERLRFPAREAIVLRFQDWRKLFLVFGGRDVWLVGADHGCPRVSSTSTRKQI
jgi:hypothetical protein